ncbi:helix-turn-helix domain-containing protein [Bacillus sp. Gen3]|nr:helix-turn-helix domain-containing protein [Bacillus sp. Gen3]
MTFLHAIVLVQLQRIEGARTVYSIYHLLKGKKSSQTIQDAHLFNLGVFFQTFPNLQRNVFDEIIHDLYQNGFITQQDELKFVLSEKGCQELAVFFEKDAFPSYLNGLKYQDVGIIFWRRLTLFVQVLSNSIHDIQKYYPIVRDPDTQIWIKSFLKQSQFSKQEISIKLFHELSSIFKQEPPEKPELFLIRLTGNQQVGLTIEQSAEYFGMEYTEYWYRFIHLLHFMLGTILQNNSEYPLLFSLIKDSHQSVPLTNSTKETYLLLKNGHSIQEVAILRKLKTNTIEDHVIEILLNQVDLDVSPYLSKELETEIIQTAAIVGKKKLKPIKEVIQEVSYFQIRLALAKNKGNGNELN